MQTAIKNLGKDSVLNLVTTAACQLGIPHFLGIDIVCSACCDNVDLAPSMRSKKIVSDVDAVRRWVEKFYNGYQGRPSLKPGKPPQTKPDPAVSKIIACAIPALTNDDISKIAFAHRLSMSAENVLGPFVEEYIFEKLKNHGWALAWGETVKSVDLCSRAGKLIQIKNRSNTENSSSDKIRVGTNIEKWFRVNATNGAYLWDELCSIADVECGYLSEDDFCRYVRFALTNNPSALGVDIGNPWV